MHAALVLHMLSTEIEKIEQGMDRSCIASPLRMFSSHTFPSDPSPLEPSIQIGNAKLRLVPILYDRSKRIKHGWKDDLDAFEHRKLSRLRKWELKKLYNADYDVWTDERNLYTSNAVDLTRPSPVKLRVVRFIVLKGPAINIMRYIDIQGRARVDFCIYTQLLLYPTVMDDKRDRSNRDLLRYCMPTEHHSRPVRLYGGPVSFVSWVSEGFSGKPQSCQFESTQEDARIRFCTKNREMDSFYDAIYPRFDRAYWESRVLQNPSRDPNNIRLYTSNGFLYEQHPLLYVLFQTVDRLMDRGTNCYWSGNKGFLDLSKDANRVYTLMQIYSYARDYMHRPERKEIVAPSLNALVDILQQECWNIQQVCAEWNRAILSRLSSAWGPALNRYPYYDEKPAIELELEQTDTVSALRKTLYLVEKYSR